MAVQMVQVDGMTEGDKDTGLTWTEAGEIGFVLFWLAIALYFAAAMLAGVLP